MSDHDKEHGEEEKGHGKSHGGGHGGGSHEEHEGVPEWMVSFADNTALMMGLFVILLALNMGPKASKSTGGVPADSKDDSTSSAEMLDFALGIREAFNNPVDPNSTDPKEQPLVRRLREKETGSTIDEGPSKKGPQSEAIKPTAYTAIGGKIPFDDNSAILSGTARQKIADIAAKVGQLRFVVEVRGHTTPSESMRNEDRSRKLSYERGMAVAQALAVQGVPWRQMRVVACGDSDRIVARTYDREQDRQNQRTEVILTNDVVPDDPYTREIARNPKPEEATEDEAPTGDEPQGEDALSEHE